MGLGRPPTPRDMDHIVCYSTSFSQCIIDLREILLRQQAAGLTVNAEKCHFGCREMQYLGHVVCADGLKPDQGKVSAIDDYPTPKNLKELERFLGMVGWYQKFHTPPLWPCCPTPPAQEVMNIPDKMSLCVSNLSNLGLKLLKKISILSQHVSDKMSQFGLNLRPFWHLRHNWDCPYLRAIWEQFVTFFCVVKKVSNMSQRGFGGFSGSMVDRWSFQVSSLYIQTLWFHN